MSTDDLKDDDMCEVTWSGRKVLLRRGQLDDWYNCSFEDRDDYLETHPWVEQPVGIKTFGAAGTSKKPDVDLSKYVVVHFNRKSLLLPRQHVNEWYDKSPEERKQFMEEHPDMLVKMEH